MSEIDSLWKSHSKLTALALYGVQGGKVSVNGSLCWVSVLTRVCC